MPELPEVEVVRMGLEKVLLGKRFRNVKVGKSKIVTSNSNKRVGSDKKVREFITGVTNKIIKKIERRAKNIIIYLEDESLILIHLKMTGQVLFNTEATKHTHIIFELDNGELLYNDVRGFGYVLYYNNIVEAIASDILKKWD